MNPNSNSFYSREQTILAWIAPPQQSGHWGGMSTRAKGKATLGRGIRREGDGRGKLYCVKSTEASHDSFISQAMLDVLPSLRNLQQSFGKDPICPFCSPPSSTVSHIRVGWQQLPGGPGSPRIPWCTLGLDIVLQATMKWRSGLQQWSHPSIAAQVRLGELLPRPHAYPHKSLSCPLLQFSTQLMSQCQS